MNCNFKCWYCYETHIKDSKMSQSTINSVIKLVESVVKNQNGLKRIIISFFGGEPLLYFNKIIIPLLQNTVDICNVSSIEVVGHMTTNGLLINDEMLTTCNKYGLKSFQITLDGNREQHNKVRFLSESKGSYDTIVNNIIKSVKQKIHVNIRINCSLNTFDNINDILNSFISISKEDKSYITFDFQKVWQEETDLSEIINNTKLDFEKMGFNVTKIGAGSLIESCYADKRYQATINYNGEIFKCTARDFKDGSGEGILQNDGNIIWNKKYENRLASKFNNEPCKTCRILPLCGGGCTQASIEANGADYCVMGFDENRKTKLITDKFETICASLE